MKQHKNGDLDMSYQQAETARKVADIIDSMPESFDMLCYETQKSCGTVRCIAGHIGHIHNDNFKRSKRPHWLWERKQASRIGLDRISGNALFHGDFVRFTSHGQSETNRKYSEILRKIAAKTENRNTRQKLSPEEMEDIIGDN